MPLYPLNIYRCPNGHRPFYSRASGGAVNWQCPDCGASGKWIGSDGEGGTWLRPARPIVTFPLQLHDYIRGEGLLSCSFCGRYPGVDDCPPWFEIMEQEDAEGPTGIACCESPLCLARMELFQDLSLLGTSLEMPV